MDDQALIEFHPPFTIHHYQTLGSTNDRLKQMPGAPEYTCVMADQQTAGRGRRERVWYSAAGEGLYLSILLRPEIEARKIPLLSLLSAVAVAETIQNFAPAKIDVKWPNDVLVNDRKISGILIESLSAANELPRFILGIGVNLNQQSFPPELQEIATSLHLESGEFFEPISFRNFLLSRVAFWYEELRDKRENKILNRWQALSTYAHGKKVVVQFDHEELTGETIGLTKIGALQLKLDSGQTRTIIAGEIKHLRSK